MFKKILIGLVVIIGIFLLGVAIQPAEYRVARTASISAPPAVVFAQVNDFHNWDAWSPWAKLDPAAKNSFEGASSGKGAIFKWSGNNKVGEGSMTIIESHPNDLVKIEIIFVQPFAGTSIAEFDFKPEADNTLVTWSMSGHKNFVSKAVCLFMNMDKTLGGEFEKGLAQMKMASEAAWKK